MNPEEEMAKLRKCLNCLHGYEGKYVEVKYERLAGKTCSGSGDSCSLEPVIDKAEGFVKKVEVKIVIHVGDETILQDRIRSIKEIGYED